MLFDWAYWEESFDRDCGYLIASHSINHGAPFGLFRIQIRFSAVMNNFVKAELDWNYIWHTWMIHNFDAVMYVLSWLNMGIFIRMEVFLIPFCYMKFCITSDITTVISPLSWLQFNLSFKTSPQTYWLHPLLAWICSSSHVASHFLETIQPHQP